MLRIGLTLPCNSLVRVHKVKKHNCPRVCLAARHYVTGRRLKFGDRFNRDVRLVPKFSGAKYSTESSKSGGFFTGTLLTLGAVTVGTLGILTYAKNDLEFRATLDGWIPGTDQAIKILFQEESSFVDKILGLFSDDEKPDTQPLQKANKPAYETVLKKSNPPSEKKIQPENVINKKDSENKIKKSGPEKPHTPEKTKVEDTRVPESYSQKEINKLANDAIELYKQAASIKENYFNQAFQAIQNVGKSSQVEVWNRLKADSEKVTQSFEHAEKRGKEAINELRNLLQSVNDPKNTESQVIKASLRKNINNLLSDVNEAKRKYESEIQNSKLINEFWKNVKTAREEFQDQLKILFPNINVNERNLKEFDEAFDLFVLYMYNKVMFYQSELEKLKIISEEKLKSALRSADNTGDLSKIQDGRIALEVDSITRKLQDEYDTKLLKEKKALLDELRNQLKLQAQIHADHMREIIAAKDKEMNRNISRAVNDQVEENNIKNKTQLAAIIGRLKGLDEAIKTRIEAEKEANEAQLLWGACQALVRVVKASPPGVSAENSARPLEKELNALIKAAPKNDSFVNAAIKGIPEVAAKRGVYPEDTLRERFLKVEQMARKLALVPEEGASLPIYLLSYLQNLLLVKAVSPIPRKELEDQPIDVSTFDTFDILQRARYWMDRGDFKMTLRYMNLLKGAPRSIANDWMNEVKILLETQQAIDALVAYAGANSLVFMAGGEGKKTDGKK